MLPGGDTVAAADGLADDGSEGIGAAGVGELTLGSTAFAPEGKVIVLGV